MASATVTLTITITVTFAWWLKPYLFGVATMSVLTGLEPDWVKVERMVMRGMKVRAA